MDYKECFKIFCTLFVAVAATSSCSSTRTVESISPAEAESSDWLDANENDASYFTEVAFQKGSAKLDKNVREELKSLVKRSMSEGQVNEIKIVTWADKDAPQAGDRVSAKEKELADERNEQIKRFFKETYPSLDVSVYNMAKRPNAIQELFKNADAQTQQSFENAGLTTNDADMNPPAKASRAVVLSIVKK